MQNISLSHSMRHIQTICWSLLKHFLSLQTAAELAVTPNTNDIDNVNDNSISTHNF